ncbi:MAG TPA: PQQ-binding-like beta-propeller repeat protein [Gaiellaceae bacterium]|nr:PQQ-binding-like beta-propeller repeat protein [Gaiellaceae bacterium]
MRRIVIVLVAVVLLLAGAIAAFVVHRLHQSADERGSTTTDYIPTQPAPKPPPPDVPWPTYGFSPDRTRSVQIALRPPFRIVWRYQAGSLIEFPPSIGYNRLFFSTNKGTFAAISARTGKYAWKYRAHRCVAASPAIGPHAHGTVYEAFLNQPPCNAQSGGHGVDGEVIAFGVGHGKIHWRHRIGPSESSPLLVGNRLYVGDWNGDVWAFDANHGRVVWHRHVAKGAIKGALAYGGGRLYVGAYDGHVYGLSRTGRVVWTGSAQPRLFGGSDFYSTPAVAYGRVYIGSTDGKVYAFGATDGRRLWSHSTGGYVYASPAIWQQRVLVGSYSGNFFALDTGTGEVRWKFHAGGPISGSAVVVDGVVYFATLHEPHLKNGRTYALDARTGKELWTFPDGKYTPVVAERGKLFLIGYGVVYGMVPKQ